MASNFSGSVQPERSGGWLPPALARHATRKAGRRCSGRRPAGAPPTPAAAPACKLLLLALLHRGRRLRLLGSMAGQRGSGDGQEAHARAPEARS